MSSPAVNLSMMQIVQIRHYAETTKGLGSEVDKLYQDDAVWIITSSFIIFTMHSGFGLLESGSVSAKDEVNIMVKNVVDVVFGGLAYWSLGYGLSYGDMPRFRNPYVGVGKFFYDPTREELGINEEGWSYAAFLFELSLATTASTIVSGAVAERAKLKSYILLGCLVILIQALPAHWVWDPEGFLNKWGVVDFAGCSAVHMVGGVIGLVATVYLKPRRQRFSEDSVHQMSSPTNALLGTFLLWWGWFGINAGSVWGITAGRWRLGARAAVATIMSSIGGGATAIVFSFAKTKKLQVNFLINGILSSIVSITAMCAVARPWHALVIGGVSAALSILVLPVLERFKIDDPVGIVPIHLTSSIWGMLAVGIFCERDKYLVRATGDRAGLIYSGSPELLIIQLECTVIIAVYSAILGYIALFCISKSPLGLRVTDYEEQIGADVIEHGLAGTNVARYVIEKPLSTRTFQTVTKAITKWKMLAKNKSRSKRMEAARLKRLEEEAAVNNNNTNGVLPNGNGNVLQHRRSSRLETGTAGTPRTNGSVQMTSLNGDLNTSRSNGAPTTQRSARGGGSTTIQIEPRTAREAVYMRTSPRSLGSGSAATPSTSALQPSATESPSPITNQEGSSVLQRNESSPSTSGMASSVGHISVPMRPTTLNRFPRTPQPRQMTPTSDMSRDSSMADSSAPGSGRQPAPRAQPANQPAPQMNGSAQVHHPAPEPPAPPAGITRNNKVAPQ